ncbi:iron-containing alcohol dehydrogenase family protein [Sporolactobacillus sp. THM7-7]|nr:iron-containing alcohol dehydrogenase family protein [Sporolactobacillus sp. THM7-7]
MTLSLIQRISPEEYISKKNAYDRLADELKARYIKRVLFLHGTKSLRKARPYLPDLSAAGIESVDILFNGECSHNEIRRIIGLLKEKKADAIIGLGGGKVMDTAKAAAYKAGGYPVILLPTMASNCAAWSPLSVLYTDDGASLGHEIYPHATSLVLVEPRVILDSPVDYFVAGVADTIAKWYESDFILTHTKKRRLALQFAREAARICKDVPLNDGEKAIEDMKEGRLTDEWINVMETNIMAGGLVGGFGDEFGRATAAHAVHDAITARPETHLFLHGIKVAYGVMVQLVLEKKWDEMEQLIPFYKALQLPLSLSDLNLSRLNEDDLMDIANETVRPNALIHLHPLNFTAQDVYEAILQLEEWARKHHYVKDIARS